MSVRKLPWLTLLVGLVVVGLPLLAHRMRDRPESGCALDGLTIDPSYRVEIADAEGKVYPFCCIRCARIWLKRSKTGRAVTVTDEISGKRLDASSAWYVRSWRITQPRTGNRIHVFQSKAEAEKYAATAPGILLPAAENPFAMSNLK